jgi:hypothetical protein
MAVVTVTVAWAGEKLDVLEEVVVVEDVEDGVREVEGFKDVEDEIVTEDEDDVV